MTQVASPTWEVYLAKDHFDAEIARALLVEYLCNEVHRVSNVADLAPEVRLELSQVEETLHDSNTFIILGFADSEPAGCVTLQRLRNEVFELRRVYVRPEFRGLGLGLTIVRDCLSFAKEEGANSVRLWSRKFRTGAIAMYRKLGFEEIEPYTNFREASEIYYMELYLTD